MNCLDRIKNYFELYIFPQIKDIVSLDDILVVISGSVSYGFDDEYSDVDVYLIGEYPRDKLVKEIQQHLFRHIIIDGFRVQIIPLILNNSIYSPLSCMLHEEYDNLKNCDMNLLFDIQHYLPVHDPKNIVCNSKVYIDNLSINFWQEECMKQCANHVDVLEAFYSSVKRGNVITGSIYFGDALKGLLQIVHLSAGSPYPITKWLYNELENVDKDMYIALNQLFADGLPCTLNDLEDNIRNITVIVTNRLKETGAVPSYIIDALLSP